VTAVAVIAGGVGAARFLAGLVEVVDPSGITAIVNVADDLELHGLSISPDLDTITYTLAGAIDPERGWGLAGETWAAMDELGSLGGPSWFSLGDRDLATHLYRTGRLRSGATLTEVTAELTAARSLRLTVLPATDDEWRTRVTVSTAAGEHSSDTTHQHTEEISFQEYFVGRRHAVPVRNVRFAGDPTPAPGVLEALEAAEVIVIAPSNPIVSIEPVLAIPGIREAVAARRDQVVAVSPIVAGAALKGPADRMLAELGHEPTVMGVARLYASFAATLVVDDADDALAPAVEALGVRCVVCPTVMHGPSEAATLARAVLEAAAVDPGRRR
jgi:LPPG:FO 2-phospho-L-lactate transferase